MCLYGCRDTDELRDFLRTITSYDDFWRVKGEREPEYDDLAKKRFWDEVIRAEGRDPANILLALKQGEVQRFASEASARHPGNLN
jgi:hypothetical protein